VFRIWFVIRYGVYVRQEAQSLNTGQDYKIPQVSTEPLVRRSSKKQWRKHWKQRPGIDQQGDGVKENLGNCHSEANP